MAGLLEEIEATLAALDPEKRAEVERLAFQGTRDMIWVPNPGPQTDAYFSPADLLYYGGGVGGGKSQLLVGLAINEHRISRLFRRQMVDIYGEGGMVPAMAQILKGRAGLDRHHVWTVPGKGNKVEFGAFKNDREADDYQGRAADFLGFDEGVQLLQHLIKLLMTWNRPGPGVPSTQRCRAVIASNPPLSHEGLWIFEMFGPWLDDRHSNPAKAGELRYFIDDKGHDIEVEKDFTKTIVDGRGNEIVVAAKSRTFIPASVVDNPDLMDANYASQVAQMPGKFQAALMGQFSAALEDDALQIIPTEWILAAQARWRAREGGEIGPMTDIGVDVSMSLSEKEGQNQASRQNDRFVVAPLHHVFFAEPVVRPGESIKRPSDGAAAVIAVARDAPRIKIDMGGGYGSGVFEHLESNDFNVVGMLGAGASHAMDRERRWSFKNKRAEWIWRFREALDPVHGDGVALPPGREIIAELACHRLKYPLQERRIIEVEEKREIVKRLGRSPDIGEAMIYAWAEPDLDQLRQRKTGGPGAGHQAHSASVQRGYASAKDRYSRTRR
jgi:hypothetical protein